MKVRIITPLTLGGVAHEVGAVVDMAPETVAMLRGVAEEVTPAAIDLADDAPAPAPAPVWASVE